MAFLQKMMLKRVFLLAALALPALAWGSGPKVKVDGCLNLSSAYIWRGEQVCNVHVNPSVAVNFAGFRLENYNYLSLDGGYKEIDWDLSYTLGDFSLHVADYYSCSPASGAAEDFFSWKKGATGHVDELALVYSSSVIPLDVKWFTFFWGSWLPDADGRPGDNSFSSFLELGTHVQTGERGTASATLGISVLKGMYTQYKESFMPVHAALAYTYVIPLSDSLSVPLQATVVWNPYTRACYAGASAGLSF